MPDPHSTEDEATLYVLGELTGDERREFEARVEQSEELRALVRELQEGAVALSIASPRRRPPSGVWARIEEAVAGETKRKQVIPAFWVGWWRSGWAAAAACLAGWLLYALWANKPPSDASSVPVASVVNSRPGTTFTPSHEENKKVAPQSNAESNAAVEWLQARTQENAALHWQIADLTNRMTHLSRALAQQQALLAEPSRLKFFQLGPPSDGSTGTSVPQVSPALQQALALALARELGWAPTASSQEGATDSGREWPGNGSASTGTNHAGVDFVDLRPGSNSVAGPIAQSQVDSELAGASESSSASSASSNAIPGFVSGTNAVMAFDSSVVPAGSSLTFLTTMSSGQSQSLGTTVSGNNPVVVTIPLGGSGLAGGNFTVIAGTPNGPTNVIGQFPAPGTIPP